MKTFLHNSGRKTNKFWIVPFLLLVFGLNSAEAQRVASVSGNWGDNATWGGLAPPTTAQTATINAGITVTVNVQATTSSLTVNGTLNVTGGNITISNGGSVTNNSGGSIVFNATNVINGGGSGSNGILIAINSGSSLTTAHANGFNNNTGSFQHNPGNRVQTYDAGANYTYNGVTQNTGANFPTNLTGVLTINSSATVTLTGTRTIANGGSIALTSGTFDAGTNLTMASTSSISRSEGSITGTLQGTGVYNLTYTGNSKTSGPEAVNTGLSNVTVNLTVAQTLTWNSTGVAPDGNLSVSVGVLDLGSNLINRSAAGGTLTVSNGATLRIGGTNTLPLNYNTHSIGSTSTIEYSGTTQTVAVLNSSQNYGNLTLSGSGVKTCAVTTVNNDFTLSGTATVTHGANLVITRDLLLNGGTFTTGNFTLSVGRNLALNGGNLTTTGTTTCAVTGTTTITTGTITLPVSAGNKTFTGLVTLNGGTLTGASTTVVLGSGITNNAGNVTLTGTATMSTASATFSGANTIAIATLTMTSPGTVTNSGTVTISTALGGNGVFAQAANATLNIGGTSTITTLTATANPNTVNYTGAAQSINQTSYNDLTLSGSNTKTFGIATTIADALVINTGVVANLGTNLIHTAASLTLGGSSQSIQTSYGGTGSPAANINPTFFAATTGVVNVGTCTPYSLSSTVNTSTCIGTAATVSVTSTVGNLPNGTYTVFYTLSNANTGNFSTTMSVTSGTGSFTTSSLANTGATTITINSLTNGCVSRLVANNSATITVDATSVGGSIAGGSTPICQGSTTGTMTLSGHTGNIVKWQKQVNGGGYSDIVNTATTYSEVPSSAGTWDYRAVVQNGTCTSVNSAIRTLVVDATSVGGSVTGGSTPICQGSTTGTMTLSGHTGSVVKWQKQVNGGGYSDIVNTATTYSEVPSSAGTWDYRAVVQNGTCTSVNSAIRTLVVDATSVGGSVTGGSTPICQGSTTGTMTLSGHTGSVVKWQKQVNGGGYSDIVNTATTYSEVPSSAGTWDYRAVVQNGTCTSVNSAIRTIVVDATSVGGSVSGTATICSGSTSGLLTLSGATGTVVRWEFTVSPFSSWTTISNTTNTHTSGALTQTTHFRAVVQNGSCAEANSSPAVVTIDNTTSTNGGVSWSNGSPSGTKSVIFDGSTATIGADFSACSLRLTNNAVVMVSGGFDVTLNGKLTVDSGSTFTLNNNANLIQNTTLANSGNIVVKRNSSALKRLDYTLWSSPVTGQGLYAFSKFTLPNRFFVYDTANDNYNNSMVGFSFNPLNFNYPSPLVSPNGVNGTDDAGVTFANGKSYLIRVPYNHPTTPTVYPGVFTGVANNGNISATVSTALNGYNAVGNPYPSRLNVHDFIDGNTNITGPLYFWRKTNTTAASTSYATLTKTAYVANGSAGGDTGTGFFPTGSGQEANWVLNIGQGFIVKATSGSTISFTNSMRRSLNADQFFRNSQTTTSTNSGLYWLNLTDNTGVYSQMALGYSAEGTLGFDRGIDGENINKEFYLTSLIGAAEYSIQGRPDFDSSDTVPLSYKALTSGNYSISIYNTDGLFTDVSQPIYVKDNLTATEHNLRTGAYTFTSNAGTFNNRFEIIYQSQLGVGTPTFSANNVIIYNQNNEFVVNAGNTIISSIKVFDIRGRLLEEKNGINATQSKIGSGIANQVLLVQIKSVDGITVTKKVVR